MGAGMSQPLVCVRNLHRYYPGTYAVRGISFDLLPGTVTGFIGANGAGKTTTMRVMATLDIPNEGSLLIDGIDAIREPLRVRRLIGWMPDSFTPYNFMTVLEYLDFFGRAYNLRAAERERRIEETMRFTDLVPLADRPINGLSKGQVQRLCLARTLLHDPTLLILDEPAAGLDPKARIEFKNAVRILRDQGKTIFISSHILSELGEMCDNLLFIDQGRLIHEGSVESLKRHHEDALLVDITLAAADASSLLSWAERQPGVAVQMAGPPVTTLRFPVGVREQLAPYLASAVREGVPITSFTVRERRLEDAFVDVLGGDRTGLNPPPLPPELGM